MELVYNGSNVAMDMDFHGYSDADWSGDPDTSHSTSGYIFISNQAAISWVSRIDRFSLGPNEEGSKRGRDGSRGGRDSS